MHESRDSSDNDPLLNNGNTKTKQYPPDPPDAVGRQSRLLGSARYILVTEFCERLAYFGFAGSLVLFFQTTMSMTNQEADIQYSAWSGACYITPLLGGYLADTYFGRYKTIFLFCIIYLIGMILMVFGCIPGNASPMIVFPAMYIIALGTGGIKPNVCTLGADQFDEKYSKDRKEKESYFNWFYWSINSASLISLTLVAYICQDGIPDLGGEDWGFFVGFSIPCIMLALATCTFVTGRPQYVLLPPNGSALGIAFNILVEALWTRRNDKCTQRYTFVSTVSDRDANRVSGDEKERNSLTQRNRTSRVSRASRYSVEYHQDHVIDKANRQYGGSFTESQVESVKLVLRITPFLVCLVPYWGIYAQMSTVFQNQGCQMNLDMGGGAQVPITALGLFDCLAIIALVPIFDMYMYPALKRRGYACSMLQKLGAGFVFAMIAMLLAAVLENFRIAYAPAPGDWYDVSARANITPCQSIDDYNPVQYQAFMDGEEDVKPLYCHQVCDRYLTVGDKEVFDITCVICDNIPQMSDLSIFWQIPQFTVVGVSEILASVTALEFFYTQAPLPMRSVCQALNLLTNAFGTWLIIPILLLVNIDPSNEWVPVNLDDGHLDWYCYLLAGLMLLDVGYFYYISRCYVYMTEEELKALEEAANDAEDEGDDGSEKE